MVEFFFCGNMVRYGLESIFPVERMAEMNNTKTGRFISACRKELGFTQCQLAEKLNVTDKAVSKWENGKCAPDIATLIPLAETLDVSVVEILNGKRMEQVELQMEADVAIVDTMKKSKKKIIISVICAVAVVLFCFLWFLPIIIFLRFQAIWIL